MSAPGPTDDKIPPRVARASRVLLIVATLCFASYSLFALQLSRSLSMKLVPALLALLMLAALRARPVVRVNVALVVVPIVLVLHGFELYLGRLKPPPAAAAARAGRTFDSRSRWEVVHDLREHSPSATVALQPKTVIELSRGPISVGGRPTVPLGGVASVPTVYCNEGGQWSIYDADEHGFNNPKGLWGAGEIELGIVGDSYTHGACVQQEEGYPAELRKRRPKTLSLGMGGNGPLLELAGIREYFTALHPKIVLWSYFRNDMPDLDVEKRVPLLMKYLDGAYSQGLIGRQAEIEAALLHILDQHHADMRSWPNLLAGIGLDRRRSPIWFQDLVMGEDNSAAAAVIRLDQISRMAAAGAGAMSFKPDFELFKKVLGVAREEVAAWGGKLYFVYIPDMLTMGKVRKVHPLREQVLRTAGDAGLPIIDIAPSFEAEPDLSALQFNPTSHCNPNGYAHIARVIGDYLDAHP
jgi:hypothetical protein